MTPDPILSALIDAHAHHTHLRTARMDACHALDARLRADIPAAAWLRADPGSFGQPQASAHTVGTRCPVTVKANVKADLSGVRWSAWVDVDRERCVASCGEFASPRDALDALRAEVQAAHRRARRPDVRSDLWHIAAALSRWLAGAP